MNWVYEGLTASLWQIAIFAVLMIISGAVIWSCNYMQISPGYGIALMYALIIMVFNLILAREKKRWSPPTDAE